MASRAVQGGEQRVGAGLAVATAAAVKQEVVALVEAALAAEAAVAAPLAA